MSEVIKNRYEFVVLFDVENGNPNGDPDAGNMPRIDPESGLGLVTDVCLKRKIRNYVETVKEDAQGYKIYIKEDVPLNRSDRTACENVGIKETDDKKVTEALKKLKKSDPGVDSKLRDYMCENYYDIRTFGAVMTTFVRTRLRKVAKQCTNYGRRVQNSVFECILDSAQSVALKGILSDIIDKNKDSLRFYYLGNNYQTKIEHVGIERGIPVDQPLIM